MVKTTQKRPVLPPGGHLPDGLAHPNWRPIFRAEVHPHPLFLLKTDISKADRRVKIRRRGWKDMVAQLGEEFCVNMVGTFGIASAQFDWGRMAALLLRVL